MKAIIMHGAGDVRVEHRPDPTIQNPTDALVRVVRAAICGSDLWPYASMPFAELGRSMGHEFLGVVEEVGADVESLRRNDLVVTAFTYSDNTCDFCREGVQAACRNGGRFGLGGVGGGQAEAIRVPLADGTLVKLPAAPDPELLPSLLTLSDVYATGYHAAVTAGVRPGMTATVIGDGAVGLMAVLAAQRLGAERIILMGRHRRRTDLGREFGATDVVDTRGDEGIHAVREMTAGDGTHRVLECVGTRDAVETALGVVRVGGVISRVGVTQDAEMPFGFDTQLRNITVTGGIAPARAYIEKLLPDVLDGTIQPGRVFDQVQGLDEVPDGYRAMAGRQALKVLIRP